MNGEQPRAGAERSFPARLRDDVRRRWHWFESTWRRSMQLRVVVSTLALSSAVVFVLGMVLQTQITNRLLQNKEDAAVRQVEQNLRVLEYQLTAVDPNSGDVAEQLEAALNQLTTSTADNTETDSFAGNYEPALVDGQAITENGEQPSAGPIDSVPNSLRKLVKEDNLASKIETVRRDGESVTMLIIGSPAGTATRPLQAYFLFPLESERKTLGLVQSTLLVGGLVLLVLLGAITNLVTRQVVRPVRQAAHTAERLAAGNLDERMRVIGEDDMARLADSFNEMADSLKQQIQQLEEFGQLQRRFTSDVSHELRTPLTTVRMAADVLHASRDDLPDGLERSAELLVDELDRFESLLGDLLEISRLDAGVADLATESLDVPDLVRRVMDSLLPIARTGGVELRGDFPVEEVHILADARRVERIVRNLVANAVDHAEGRPVDINFAADDRSVAVTVRDYGVGLRPGEAELVFTRFWRADPSRDRQTGGTGLGLSIAAEDARLHGGWLDAWGEPGKGSCFRLTLPRDSGDRVDTSPLSLPSTRSIAAPEALLAVPGDATDNGSTPPDEGYDQSDQGPTWSSGPDEQEKR
ncbi:two-component system, OmpR family, sensor histidine kinase MtrB [Actinopolyspora lacussalsi subsp. righensis]|uniref:Sensor histidine kinase MtrB n=2 Tax=Actinopolyspora righensis TaxID=995060 RepID=A0A1I6YGQ9_9ACTN|nr:MtrAB system histidine kinase MtrB [Actinopolyspora righensis]SFT49725.1 two-component system, OmpR family, sensor histidine kinase MtrB [Actinopolyspora righensis]